MENRDDDFDGRDWLEAELADTLDEDYELEISEPALSLEIRKIYRKAHPPSIPRMDYFRALLRLQSELIKLQDWVSYKKEKIVVIFEGRDSAGKGGVIKRITQRLNPRVARVVALPAPTERERSQWYFQRYVPHLPAGGEIVLFDRSWYNRSGVERVMGFAFPRDERAELVAAEPAKFALPSPSDMRFHWVHARLPELDPDEARELVVDAWRMVVPQKVSRAYDLTHPAGPG